MNAGGYTFGGYGIYVSYDPAIISITSTQNVVSGPHGFQPIVNLAPANKPAGTIMAAGLDITGAGIVGHNEMHILSITFTPVHPGQSVVDITVDSLSTETGNIIGNPQGVGGIVTVQ